MFQEITVFLMVALAAVYAVWKFMPRALRGRLAQVTVGWARRRGRLSDDGAAALSRRLTASGCGTCESCRACGPDVAATPGTGSAPEGAVVHFVPGPAEAGRLPR